jgi:hypothetical protein
MSTPYGNVSTQPSEYTYQPPPQQQQQQQPQSQAPLSQEQQWDQQWYQLHPNEGQRPVGYHGEGGGGNPADTLLQAVQDPMVALFQQYSDKLSEFDKNNPFAFDEVQAKASAGERLNPYYNATLNEYITGWRRSASRSTEDMTRTVGELNADASKLSERERFSTQEAIRASEEGNAGAGLFFSGKRARETGIQEVGGLQKQQDITTNLERGIGSAQRTNTRTAEDLALQEARTTRLTEAERTTALETDIANQKKEAQIKRELEKQAYAGQAPGGSFQNQLSYQNSLYGMY